MRNNDWADPERNEKGGMEGVIVTCRPCGGEDYTYKFGTDKPRECVPCGGTGKVEVGKAR